MQGWCCNSFVLTAAGLMYFGNPVVITDLDGTLLDHETYGFAEALPAIERLHRNSIPLVLCSSKTAAELRAIRKRLDNRHPFIVENGGGIYLPVSGSRGRQSFEKLVLGKTRSGTLQVLKSLRDRQQYDFTGFADMTRAELMGYTGLDAEQAKLAMRREYTEPILWRDSEQAWLSFCEELRRRGLVCVSGGRFHHVQGNCDKSIALERLRNHYQLQSGADPTIVALGNDENDIRMLEAADIAFIIGNNDNADMRVGNPHCSRSKLPGPAGWNACVNEYLDLTG